MNLAELNKVAQAMVTPGKGILAADESTGTIKKRFDSIGVASTADTRRDYRELLFRSTEAMSKHISGVILYDETIRQTAKDATPLVKLIERAGAIPGIKVDKGTKPLAFYSGEVITEGLDGLRERLAEYRGLGAGFAKWRAVIDIGSGIPSYACIHANAHALARYAALCLDEDIVPIVEPEVLMDGGHDIDRCEQITQWVLKTVYEELYLARVQLEGTVLKPNMVVPGKKSGKRASVEEVAEKTIRVLKNCVPVAVPGIAFLSGGQSEEEATAHLDAMNKIGGVQICLKTAINDSYSGVHLSAGCHDLNGTQALAFVRDRHSFATEDLQRIQDQRAFLSALLNKATSPGVYLNPFTALPFGSTAASSMSVDKGTSLLDLVHAASALRDPQTGTVPIANSNYYTNAGDSVLWNKTQATELFNALKNNSAIPKGLLAGTTTG